MSKWDRVLISGASGAVGSYVLRRLLASPLSSEIVCVFRSSQSYERLITEAVPEAGGRIVPLYLDLACGGIEEAASKLWSSRRCLAIHCAADISWTKSEEVIAPLNVAGAVRFARLATALGPDETRIAMLSTAYADGVDGLHRSAYESTKLAAERALVEYGRDRLQLCILRASLVVGASNDGWIGRFNGLYPLVRLIALADVPCVVGHADATLDMIPIDWLCRELLDGIERLSSTQPLLRITAAAGPAVLTLQQLVALVQARTNLFLSRHQRPALPEIAVLGKRQYEFLMRASDSWGLRQRFYHLQRVMDVMHGYQVYAGESRRITPLNTQTVCPSPEDFLPRAIDHWLSLNAAKVLQRRRPSWLGQEETVT